MIHLRYLAEAKHESFKENSLKLLIVRSPQGSIPEGFTHFPHFAPSSELLKDALRWKSGDFTIAEEVTCIRNGVSKRNPIAWWILYKPIFLKELQEREDVKIGKEIIKKEIGEGRDIYLFCYCKELDTCHRLLIGEHLEELGFDVGYGKKEEIEISEDLQISMF